MAMRQVDVIALGGLLGYTPGQTRSIKDIHISGSNHRVTVTRFVQNPGSQQPCKTLPTPTEEVLDFVEAYDHSSLVADDIFYYRAVQPKEKSEPEYLKISKAAVGALKRLQWGE